MSNLPTIKLHNAVNLVTDKASGLKNPNLPYIGLEHIDSNNRQLKRIGSAIDSISINNSFKKHDILFGKLRPQLKKCIQSTTNGYCSTDILVFRAANKLSSRYMGHIFCSDIVFAEAIRTEEGTGMPRTSWAAIKDLDFFYPSYCEQCEIAEILTTVDNLIEQTEAAIAKYQAIKQGMMHDLFTRGVDANGHLRPPREEAPEFYKESELGWIPKEWSAPKLQSIFSKSGSPMRSGPFGSQLKKSDLQDSGIPFLGIDNIHVEHFNSNYIRFISPKTFIQLKKFQVFPKDVIITIMGTVGRCCLVPDDIDTAISSKHIWTMTFDRQEYIPDLICWQLNHSKLVLEQFAKRSQGAVMQAINASDLRNTRLPQPPIDEQKIIMKKYTCISNKCNQEMLFLLKMQKAKSGLMQDLLSGRVRVPTAATATQEPPHAS